MEKALHSLIGPGPVWVETAALGAPQTDVHQVPPQPIPQARQRLSGLSVAVCSGRVRRRRRRRTWGSCWTGRRRVRCSFTGPSSRAPGGRRATWADWSSRRREWAGRTSSAPSPDQASPLAARPTLRLTCTRTITSATGDGGEAGRRIRGGGGPAGRPRRPGSSPSRSEGPTPGATNPSSSPIL